MMSGALWFFLEVDYDVVCDEIQKRYKYLLAWSLNVD